MRVGEGNVLTRAFASSLLMFLWTSGKGTSAFIMPDNQKPDVASPVAQRVAERMPGLPPWVLNMIVPAPVGTCGGCASFSAGKCEARNLMVSAIDPECPIYEARGGVVTPRAPPDGLVEPGGAGMASVEHHGRWGLLDGLLDAFRGRQSRCLIA